MLSDAHVPVIRATIPAVAAHGTAITGAFYDSLFAAHPELLSLFNLGNQANGDQRQALAASVVAYAAHLVGEGGPGFERVLERIAHKHASLGVQPAQYAVVGRHLMGAVGAVLGDAVTPEVAAAWDEVFWLFATQLVAAEAGLYTRSGTDAGHPWRPWQVVRRVREAAEVVSLHLVPVEGAVPAFRPGQYVTVAVDLPDGRRQPRQYTISSAPGRDHVRITVRRVAGSEGPDGLVSTHLHDRAREGDVLDLSHPFGDVALPPGDGPVVLVSAGIGITPAAAMIDHLARTARGREVVAAEIAANGARLERFTQLTWYEQDAPADARAGLLDPDAVPLPAGAWVHLCGPLPFLRVVRSGLLARGADPERLVYEVFGSDLWAQDPDPEPVAP